jgi:lysophospholipase L1-like esterase
LAAEGLVGGSRRVLPKKGVVRVTEQERQQNLQRLVRVAEERHIAVLLLDPPLPAVHPVRRWLGDRYGEDLRAAADGHAGVRVLDLNAILANEPPSNIFQWDNVHPTANGHRRIAEEIARFMKDHHLPPCDGRGS